MITVIFNSAMVVDDHRHSELQTNLLKETSTASRGLGKKKATASYPIGFSSRKAWHHRQAALDRFALALQSRLHQLRNRLRTGTSVMAASSSTPYSSDQMIDPDDGKPPKPSI
jgi:hypothetical protein